MAAAASGSQNKIPIYKPNIGETEKKYVNECLESGWISSRGRFVEKFEDTFAKFLGIKYAASVCNGTCALHLALLALGIKQGDEVIVPTLTYVASVNAIAYTGATPVFVDSQKNTWLIDPDEIERKITPKTRAILVVHLYGYPCDMEKIQTIAKKHNLFLVEDCAESFGSKYNNQHSGTFGDIAMFSFYGNKTITTGEGGMVVTNDKILYEKAKKIKGQGVSEQIEYWHEIIGYNYRMTNICAAIGLAQLEKIDTILEKKREIVQLYKKYLRNVPVEFQEEQKHVYNSYWMVSILLPTKDIRDNVRTSLAQNNVETRPVFHPIHMMPMYDKKEPFPVAQNISKRGINLPSWPGLSEEEIELICKIISKEIRL